MFFQSRVPAFRERYVQFWFHLSEKLQSSEDVYVASKEGLHMLKVITDQLVSLSRYKNWKCVICICNIKFRVTLFVATLFQSLLLEFWIRPLDAILSLIDIVMIYRNGDWSWNTYVKSNNMIYHRKLANCHASHSVSHKYLLLFFLSLTPFFCFTFSFRFRLCF